jgi:hypothetical protein
MQCAEVREVTASEELTVEVDYAISSLLKSRLIPFKGLTFVILARPLEPSPTGLTGLRISEPSPMIGVVNIFFKNPARGSSVR